MAHTPVGVTWGSGLPARAIPMNPRVLLLLSPVCTSSIWPWITAAPAGSYDWMVLIEPQLKTASFNHKMILPHGQVTRLSYIIIAYNKLSSFFIKYIILHWRWHGLNLTPLGPRLWFPIGGGHKLQLSYHWCLEPLNLPGYMTAEPFSAHSWQPFMPLGGSSIPSWNILPPRSEEAY